jgi:hypothetical protein
MIIYRYHDPEHVLKYKLVGALHPAINRIGEHAATATVTYQTETSTKTAIGIFYKKKLIAVEEYNVYHCVRVDGEHYKKPSWFIDIDERL